VNPSVNPFVNPCANPVVNPCVNPRVHPFVNPCVNFFVNPFVNHFPLVNPVVSFAIIRPGVVPLLSSGSPSNCLLGV